MCCIIELLVDGAVTLYSCGNTQTFVSLQAEEQEQRLREAVSYINAPVGLPNDLIHYKYTHSVKNGCNISELIRRVFMI